MGSAGERCCSTRRGNAHRTEVAEEREVLYPWHPWAGCIVHVHEAIEKVDGIVLRCSRVGALVGAAGLDVRSHHVPADADRPRSACRVCGIGGPAGAARPRGRGARPVIVIEYSGFGRSE
jgi:hypothetical protein